MQGEAMRQESGARAPDRVQALQSRVDELNKLVQQLEASRVSAKRARTGVVIGVLLVFLIFGLSFYKMYKDFDQQVFVAEMQAKLMQPDAETIQLFQKYASEVMPVYMTEVQTQFGKEWPNIQKQLQDESQKYVATIGDKVEARIKEKIDTLAKKQEAKIVAEFPALKEAKDREIVMTNLEKALQGAVVDVLQDRVSKAEHRVWDVYDEMVKFLPKESQGDFHDRMTKVWDALLTTNNPLLKQQ